MIVAGACDRRCCDRSFMGRFVLVFIDYNEQKTNENFVGKVIQMNKHFR